MLPVLAILLIALPFSVVADCPAGALQWPLNSMCYSFIEKEATFSAAEYECQKTGGNLASIHDGFLNTFLKQEASLLFTTNATTDFWIGASRPPNGQWGWIDRTPFDFTEWSSPPTKNCASMSRVSGLWTSDETTARKAYVCATLDPSASSTSTISTIKTTTSPGQNCSYEWYYFEETSSCYYSTDSLSWQDAENYCRSQNSHLASIHSDSEGNFAQTIYNGNLWIGLSTNDNPIEWNTTWKWTDNSAVDYLPWYTFPSLDGERCVQLYPYNIMNFNNYNCTLKRYALCKKPAATVFSTPAPISTLPPPITQCLTNWTYYPTTDSCYFQTFSMNWTSAEQFCNYKGGHLASVHSSNESSWISYNFNGYPWVGLYSDDGAISFKYTDKTPFDYRKWQSNNPQRGGPPCVYMNYGAFGNDQNCGSNNYGGICKMPARKL